MKRRPDSYRYAVICRFCASYRVEQISIGNYRHICDYHGFEFNYKDEPYQKVCDDFLDEDQEGNDA